jgi:anti-sigma factor RsiW
VEIVQHVSEDDLERYAMRFLPAPESEQLEEHLLVCQSCRDRLEATDRYVAAMKAAAGKIRESGTGE